MKLLTLILATFRELFSKATLYVLLAISALILLGVLLSVSSEQTDEGINLKVFGNPISPAPVPVEQFEPLVFGMQMGLAKGLFFGIMLFGVFATASIIPDSLEKGTVDLYLSKPLARWELLVGKFFGAVAVMSATILFFIGGLWLVFGVKVGIWNWQLPLSSLTISFMFACIFSIVLFFGVLFRNTAIPIIGCFLYLAVIDNVLENREQIFAFTQNKILHGSLDVFYCIFPQISAMQKELSNQIIHQPMDWKPFAQALASSLAIFGSGVWLMRTKDF
jgi:ABC-type transport system involved in multi-copper enzyme maturation permease subunit